VNFIVHVLLLLVNMIMELADVQLSGAVWWGFWLLREYLVLKFISCLQWLIRVFMLPMSFEQLAWFWEGVRSVLDCARISVAILHMYQFWHVSFNSVHKEITLEGFQHPSCSPDLTNDWLLWVVEVADWKYDI